jgi:hypothetical protein
VNRLSTRPNHVRERSFDFVDDLVRSHVRLQVHALLGVADRATGRAQPSNQTGALRLVEFWICHPPQPAPDDEVATVRRHRMLHVG